MEVQADDGWQGKVTASFTLITGTGKPNNAPTTGATTIPDQEATAGSLYTYSIPDDAFADADGDDLVLSVSLADGSALPTWLEFEVSLNKIEGTPESSDEGTLSLMVSANDQERLTPATQTFSLKVSESWLSSALTWWVILLICVVVIAVIAVIIIVLHKILNKKTKEQEAAEEDDEDVYYVESTAITPNAKGSTTGLKGDQATTGGSSKYAMEKSIRNTVQGKLTTVKLTKESALRSSKAS